MSTVFNYNQLTSINIIKSIDGGIAIKIDFPPYRKQNAIYSYQTSKIINFKHVKEINIGYNSWPTKYYYTLSFSLSDNTEITIRFTEGSDRQKVLDMIYPPLPKKTEEEFMITDPDMLEDANP